MSNLLMKQQGLHVPNSGETTIYLRRHSMKVIGSKTDATYPECVFARGIILDHRLYLNIRPGKRTGK